MFTLAKTVLAQLHVSQSKGIQVNGCKQKHSGTFYQYYKINMNIINMTTDQLDMKLREITDTLKV